MKFLQELNPVQRQAVEAIDGPVMVIAGAGSGKTRVLTYRVAYLLTLGVPPEQILALTFTNKAANEMKTRIQALIGNEARNLWMGTFHSMFARVLRKESMLLQYTRSFSIYDSDDSLSVVKRVMEKLNISTQMLHPHIVRSRISVAKNQYLTPAQVAQEARETIDNLVAEIYKEYERQLNESNAMDFDDLLVKPIVLFQRYPALLEKYQHRFRYILVDEFQDTNPAQYRMVQLLGARYRNIAVVGDDAQSIYSFRGADIQNILNFEKDYSDCRVFRLEQNYRSTKTIISVADRLIRYNVHQLKKELWTDNAEGDPVTVLECSDEKDEGVQIVRAIQKELHRRKLDLKDFVVLYRTNAQSRALEDAFRRNGIPYEIVGGIRFYERKEIKDLLAYFRVLTNPYDEESLLRIINYPPRGIGDASVEHIRRFAEKHSLKLYDVLCQIDSVPDITDRAKQSITLFLSFLKKYDGLRTSMSLSEWARALVDELGILKIFKEEQTLEARNRWENVQELLSALSEYTHDNPNTTLEDFLEEVALVSDIDTWEGRRNAITLMTLHASKGLEFPVVFIAGLEEGLLPFYTSTVDTFDIEEERRLFYVGITRAELKLYLTYTRLRYRYGDVTYPQHSRFLSEIHGERVEYRRLSHVQRKGFQNVVQQKHAQQGRNIFECVDPIPSYEHEPQRAVTLKRGVCVQHDVFGVGKVLAIDGKGESQKAIVEFEHFGRKQLLVRYANLKPV
ncbi:MAG: UvrD-helicase domain-containing protein [Bacteroidetes bacterium]|nr:UvrD-helicase domain-containing protein [Bacteroidota bacterium]